jgi:hypothetical protein
MITGRLGQDDRISRRSSRPSRPRHPDVDERHVVGLVREHLDGLVGAARFGDLGTLDAGGHQVGQPAANQGMVVHQEDLHEATGWIGRAAMTRVPPPYRESTRSLPPVSATLWLSISRPG